MELWMYQDEYVKIKSISGNVYEGFADIYSHADDNANGIASLDVDLGNGMLMAFAENEIESIEIINATVADIANAM